MTRRRVALALLGLLGLDLFVIIVTGSSSLFAPFGFSPVGPWGFVLRLVAVGMLAVAAFRSLPPPGERMEGGRLALLLLLLPTLAQFQFAGGRISGDGVMYYVYVRSLWKDFDLDLTNEYTHYELIKRSDLAVPTKTGLRRSIFSIGPAVVWTPFFFLGEGVARAEALLGDEVDLSGYGPCHRNAVALGSLLYGFAAVLLIHDLLRRHFRPGTALAGALLAWLATFLHWYMVQQPTMSHATSAFGAAFALWLWERDRERRTPWGFLLLGLAFGIAMCLRWQNGVLLLLPGLELLSRWRREPAGRGRLALGAGLVGIGTLLGALPQMVAWKALYDEWVLRYPPHGTDFLRLDHPFVLNTLFSSRHGLLAWTPVFWAAYLGFFPLARRRPQLAGPLAIPLVLMTYVNMCSGDWWAGGSYSNRRFDSLLPILAFGLAASIDVARGFLARQPRSVLALFAVPFVAWNLSLTGVVARGLVPRDEPVAFTSLVGHAARVFSDTVGSPTTWPASWLFAWRENRSPGQYDALVGRYLFYRQNNLGGHIEIGAAGDDALLGEGWGPIESRGGAGARRVKGRARLFAPLDVAEALEVRFRVLSPAGAAAIVVAVNGREAGRIGATPAWGEARLALPAAFWRRELNDVVLDAGDAEVFVDAVDFARAGARDAQGRGSRDR